MIVLYYEVIMFSKILKSRLNFFKSISEICNPRIGDKILKLQKPSLLIRIDGRSPDSLHIQDGFQPRVSGERLKSVTASDVEDYQKFNANPFGWGACQSLKEIMTFMQKNKSQTDQGWLYKFFGKATPLLILKQEVGADSHGHDDEKEVIITEHIPLKNFIASIAPEDREMFMDGREIPNAMYSYNSSLPESLSKQDLLTQQDILAWLLRHDAEESFTDLCQTVFSDMPQDILEYLFQENPGVVSAITSALEKNMVLNLL